MRCRGLFSCSPNPADGSGLLASGAGDLLNDMLDGIHVIAGIAQLRHQQFSNAEREEAIQLLKEFAGSTDPALRRAAERTLALLKRIGRALHTNIVSPP